MKAASSPAKSRTVLEVAAFALALACVIPTAAKSAYPGANGSIVYTRSYSCAPAPGVNFPPKNHEIFTIRPDGSSETNLSNNICPTVAGGPFPDTDGTATYSPDGTKLAFGHSTALQGASGIYVMNADGSGKSQATSGGGSAGPGPYFSPDGTKLLFSQFAAGGQEDLFTVPVAGGTPTQLTPSPEREWTPVYSPDGSRIAYQAYQPGV